MSKLPSQEQLGLHQSDTPGPLGLRIPFEGACWHEGDSSSQAWLPWLTCDAVGRAILDVAGRQPATSFLVLSGRTHSPGRSAPAPKVLVHTAGAICGHPAIQGSVELDSGSMKLAA